MASPLSGIDPQTLMMIVQKLGLSPGAAAMGGPGQPPLGGPGQPPLGAPPPALSVGGPPGAPPPGGAPGGIPGAPPAPPAPAVGGQSPFDPSDAPMGGAPAGGAPRPPRAGSPYMDAVNMTMGQSAFGPEERSLDRQMKIADELRASKAPGMRGEGGHGYVTAASPFEFAATAMDRVGGKMMGDRTEAKQKTMFEDRMKRLREDMEASKGV